MTAPMDFQSDENRWAAEMACEEANAVSNRIIYGVRDTMPHYPAIYALALRILRTETRPASKDLLRAREIVADLNDDDGSCDFAGQIRLGIHDGGLEVRIALAALKEGRGE